MKLTAILAAAFLFSLSAAQAQVDSSQSDQEKQKEQQQQDQSSQDQSTEQSEAGKEISEPSGAETPDSSQSSETPSGRAFDAQNPPPGRAFDKENPPQGKPFESGELPPGRPFQEGQEAGVPTEEPAGAESQQGQQQEQQQQPDQQQQTAIDEAAGAQRGGSEQLARAFGEIKTGTTAGTTQKTSIQQALTTSVQGKNIPNEFITRLSDDLTGVFTKTEIKEDVRVRLADTINSILVGQISTGPQLEQALTTIEQTLTSAGVARPAARTVACDMHLIGTELIPDLKIVAPQ